MIIKRLKISEKTQRATSQIITEEVEKPYFYKGLEIELIDFTETTAWCNFADVKFKGHEKIYLINTLRLDR